MEWLAYHDLDPQHVISVEIDTDTAKHGSMRVISYATIGSTRRMAGHSDALTEERIIQLKAMPGEVVSQQTLQLKK
jgi:hypothetical protein